MAHSNLAFPMRSLAVTAGLGIVFGFTPSAMASTNPALPVIRESIVQGAASTDPESSSNAEADWEAGSNWDDDGVSTRPGDSALAPGDNSESAIPESNDASEEQEASHGGASPDSSGAQDAVQNSSSSAEGTKVFPSENSADDVSDSSENNLVSSSSVAADMRASQLGWYFDGGKTYYGERVKGPDGTFMLIRHTGWLVSDTRGEDGLQRYWFDSSGALVTDALIDVGDGTYAYARPEGYVVRGAWSNGSGRVYLADNDGRLAGGPKGGWVVSDDYGHGLQRYWIDPSTHAAIVGRSDAGWAHYTTDKGYVLRGNLRVDDRVYLADNDGRLAGGTKGGWVVSDKYGQGLQRYWIDPSTRSAIVGRSDAGWAHYTTDAGYVLRGADRVSGYYADNDGKLASNTWVVTDGFGQGMQRYWFDTSSSMAKNRLIDPGKDASGWWGYALSDGTILRGSRNVNDKVYLADNDGRLAGGAKGGWVVSDKYGQGLQRYWIDAASHAAIPGFSTDGYSHYTTDAGYVLRGAMPWGGHVLLADNDGRLASSSGWVVTDKYGQGLQRYWLEQVNADSNGNIFYGAKLGYFKVGSDEYYGRPEGYVLRGGMMVQGTWVNADNDGKILRYLNGIDIAGYQGALDLSKISADFVFVKATEGTGYVNPTFRKHADQTLRLGKKLGLYHFVDTRVSPEAQADYFLEKVGPYIGKAALMLDWENNDVNGVNNLSKGPAFAKRFLDRVYQRTGIKPMIYMSRSVVYDYNWTAVADAGYQLWCAQYLYKYYDTTNGVDGFVANPDRGTYGSHGKDDYGAWGSRPTMYQYTSTGKLDGWNGFLDFDVFYGTGSDWDKLASSVGRMMEAAVSVARYAVDRVAY